MASLILMFAMTMMGFSYALEAAGFPMWGTVALAIYVAAFALYVDSQCRASR